MKNRIRTGVILALLTAGATIAGPAGATSEPWTERKPGGTTWVAPNDCTLKLDILTWDEYDERATTPEQKYELVVVYASGIEIGRTEDLLDGVKSAKRERTITATLKAGDVVTVKHSTQAGMKDGTQNSVRVKTTFSCPPVESTTTTAASTTTSTVTPTTSTVAPTTTAAPTTVPESSTTIAATTTVPATSSTVPVTTVPTSVQDTVVTTSTVAGKLPKTGPPPSAGDIVPFALLALGAGTYAWLLARRPRRS